MDKCGICQKPATQLFETGNDILYACFKCQPLVPEVTIGDSSVEQASVITTEETNETEALYCGICHKTFQKNMQLQNHLRNHRAERRFVCTYCNKAFSQSNNLRAHLRIHTNERPYKCQECGKAFTQVTNLNNHVRLHTGERPFVCPEPGCSKAYAQVTNLNQHRKRHLSGRPVDSVYECTECGQQFQQRNHLYVHRRVAHGELKSPSRSHSCSLCEQTFSTERQLHQHRVDHDAAAALRDSRRNSRGQVTGRMEEDEGQPLVEIEVDGERQGDAEGGGGGGGDGGGEGGYACVFSVCAMRFASPREHTEHLLRAHQLRVLATRAHTDSAPPRRGRPPKSLRMEEVRDPLALDPKETEVYHQVKNTKELRFPKLTMQSLFQ